MTHAGCDCPLFDAVRHLCPRYGFHVNQTERQLCEKRPEYREAFARPDAPQRVREKRLMGLLSNPPPAPVAPSEEQFPCVHRLAVVDLARPCNLCGLKGTLFAVHGCNLHGECSIGRKHSKVKSCVTCRDRRD